MSSKLLNALGVVMIVGSFASITYGATKTVDERWTATQYVYTRLISGQGTNDVRTSSNICLGPAVWEIKGNINKPYNASSPDYTEKWELDKALYNFTPPLYEVWSTTGLVSEDPTKWGGGFNNISSSCNRSSFYFQGRNTKMQISYAGNYGALIHIITQIGDYWGDRERGSIDLFPTIWKVTGTFNDI